MRATEHPPSCWPFTQVKAIWAGVVHCGRRGWPGGLILGDGALVLQNTASASPEFTALGPCCRQHLTATSRPAPEHIEGTRGIDERQREAGDPPAVSKQRSRGRNPVPHQGAALTSGEQRPVSVPTGRVGRPCPTPPSSSSTAFAAGAPWAAHRAWCWSKQQHRNKGLSKTPERRRRHAEPGPGRLRRWSRLANGRARL